MDIQLREAPVTTFLGSGSSVRSKCNYIGSLPYVTGGTSWSTGGFGKLLVPDDSGKCRVETMEYTLVSASINATGIIPGLVANYDWCRTPRFYVISGAKEDMASFRAVEYIGTVATVGHAIRGILANGGISVAEGTDFSLLRDPRWASALVPAPSEDELTQLAHGDRIMMFGEPNVQVMSQLVIMLDMGINISTVIQAAISAATAAAGPLKVTDYRGEPTHWAGAPVLPIPADSELEKSFLLTQALIDEVNALKSKLWLEAILEASGLSTVPDIKTEERSTDRPQTVVFRGDGVWTHRVDHLNFATGNFAALSVEQGMRVTRSPCTSMSKLYSAYDRLVAPGDQGTSNSIERRMHLSIPRSRLDSIPANSVFGQTDCSFTYIIYEHVDLQAFGLYPPKQFGYSLPK